MKKLVCILPLIAILFSLSACGGGGTVARDISSDAYGADKESVPIYSRIDIQFEECPELVTNSLYSNGQETLSVAKYANENRYAILRINPVEGRVEKLAYETVDTIIDLSWTPQGNITLMGFDSEEEYFLREIGESGGVVLEIDMEKIIQEEGILGLNSFECLEEEIVVTAQTGMMVIDYEGEVLQSRQEYRNRFLIRGHEGQLLFWEKPVDGELIIGEYTGDIDNMTEYSFSRTYGMCHDGWYSQGVYCVEGNTLYSLDYKTGEKELVFDDSVNVNFSSIVCASKGLFLNVQGILDMYNTCLCSVWERKEDAKVLVLTMAAYGADNYLKDAVSRFNQHSDSVKIRLEDYVEEEDSASSEDGLTRLTTEISAGKIPDLFDLKTLPYDSYASKGLLLDLRPHLDGAPRGYGELVPSVAEALTEEGGSMYSLVPSFKVSALAASSELVGKSPGWSMTEFLAFAHERGADKLFSPDFTGADFIHYALSFTEDDYLDRSAGVCNFESESFYEVLSVAAALPEESDDQETSEYLMAMDGRMSVFLRVTGLPVMDLVAWDKVFDGKTTLKGFPSSKGTGVSARAQIRVGVSAESEYQREALGFIDFLLSDEYQRVAEMNQYLPVVDEKMEENILASIEEYTNEPLCLMQYDMGVENILECSPPRESTFEDVRSLIDRIDRIDGADESVYAIIMDEAAAYFAGDKTAQEAAELIQSRVSIYVSEQSG